MTRALSIMVLGLSLLSACATQSERLRNLNDTLRAYEQAIRWGDFAGAFGFMETPPEDAAVKVSEWQDIRVSGYRAGPLQLGEENRQAMQMVEIHYYDTQTMRERALVDRQQWRYDADKERWYRVNVPASFR